MNEIINDENKGIESGLKYNSFSSGGSLKIRESDKLPGALAADQNFFFSDIIKDENGPEAISNYGPVKTFIPTSSGICTDYKEGIFINGDMAVVNAFDLRTLPENERQKAIEEIVIQSKLMYPDYGFVMLPGNFPISVEGSLTMSGECIRDARADMSTHILYIKDYKKHLVNNKGKQFIK